jgi:sugar/nucleoside kinase (ribokinase family)
MAHPSADRPRDLLVAGHVNVDRFITVRAFPAADRTVPVVRTQDRLGGTAANLALVAARFGVKTGLVARIGDGFPEEYVDRLKAAKVDTRGLVSVSGVGTPTCFIIEDESGHQRTLIDQGAMARLERTTVPRAVLRDYAWLHVTTGNPEYHLRLVRAARELGVRVAVDPAQEIHYWWDRRRFLALLEGAEALFGNRSEIARAMQLCEADSPELLVDRVPLVIRTEGAQGVTAFTRGASVHVPAVRTRRVRSIVGAGDAFRGGFYAAWFAGRPLKGCLGAGVRAAARWVATPGGEA